MTASRSGLSPEDVARTLRRSAGPGTAAERRVHEHLGHVSDPMDFDRRSALLAAARSRGTSTSVDDELDRIGRLLSERTAESPEVDLASARRRVAETAREIDALRERVATLRGRLQAMRERGEPAGAKSAYRDAIRELSEAETEHAAALERLDRDRKLVREVRDEREHRMRLADRLDNLERTARDELLNDVEPLVERAIATGPWETASLPEADDTTVALAILRISSCPVPVVLSCRRFASVSRARAYLRTPVVRL